MPSMTLVTERISSIISINNTLLNPPSKKGNKFIYLFCSRILVKNLVDLPLQRSFLN